MKNHFFINIGTLILSLFLLGSLPAATFAQRADRVTNRQVQTTLQQIKLRSEVLSRSLEDALNGNNSNRQQNSDEIRGYLRDFQNAAETLRNQTANRAETSANVQDVLDRAANIDNFIRQNRLNSSVNRDWAALRTDLNTLAGYYNVSPSWNNNSNNNGGRYNNGNNGGYNNSNGNNGGYNNGSGNNRGYNRNNRLNGTYQLNSGQSTDVEAEISRAVQGLSSDRQDRIRQNARRRLESPGMLAIERNGTNITLATSKSPQLSFVADGRANSEQMNNGRTMTTTAKFTGDRLTIDFSGDRTNGFNLTFEPLGNNSLRLTRTLYLEGVDRQITVSSIYDKTSDVADFTNVYRADNSGNINNSNGDNNRVGDNFLVPNETQLTAVLNQNLSTKTSLEGDHFTMEVRSPSQYSGAILEGHVSKLARSGKVSGNAQMTLEFDSIRLNGQTYRFAGFVQSARGANGENIRISNEGDVSTNGSQTKKTVTRAGIGAVLGAIVGAVAGGGEGAAIGAGVGAGAGAGSVLIQGRDDLELKSGAEITVSASSPRSVAARN